MGETSAEFKLRVLNDTGDFARDVLGYVYDEAEGGRKINVGTGGIVRTGKTQEFIELLDDRVLTHKLALMPRESRKSTILQAYCCRQILINPNIRIFYVARTGPMVQEKALAIRSQLERDEVTALFGKQEGAPWGEERFSVAGRTAVGLMNATLTTFTYESVPHGGRADIVILDDFIDDSNCTNPEMLEKARKKWRSIQPLFHAGAKCIVVGTVWDDEDVYADMEGSPLFDAPHGGQVVCGAGVDIYYDREGNLKLREGEHGITFPHLTVEYLQKKLWGMMAKGQSPVDFQKQYLNQRATDELTSFRRKDFKPVKWERNMDQLTGYLLSDTATSKKKSGCYSVLAYVGIDPYDNFYVLDMRVGRWDQNQFLEEFFDVLSRWQPLVNHGGEAWEEAELAQVYMDGVQSGSRRKKIQVNPITMKRGNQSDSKPVRILAWQPIMRNGRFWVVDTVPETFEDVTVRSDRDGNESKTRELWNPEGFHDPRSKRYMPSGYLVDTFLRPGEKKDGADALAMILEYQKVKGRSPKRYCTYKTWRPKPLPAPLTEQRKDAYHRAEYQNQSAQGEDWWDKTLNDFGF